MNLPGPNDRQARILWASLTGLAVGILLALGGLLTWGAGWLITRLASVLWPLAVAAVLSYLLDPAVDFLERFKVPRARGILLVFFAAAMLVFVAFATIVPQLLVESKLLIDQVPAYSRELQGRLSHWLEESKWGLRAKEAWDSQYGAWFQGWLANVLPEISSWLLTQLSRAASWGGLIVGLALVPVYAFYFLLEKQGIQRRWTDYLPIHESRTKEELVFVLRAINDHLIVFFRGQILVALCDGALLTTGFLLVGLNYAFLLGMVAGLLSIVPYLGVAVSLIPAVILALVQFGDWTHPLLVLLVFASVQAAEGFFISPKIIGDRVGLHPLTIIIAVMVGTTLLGGVLGGVLAIPLTAALRVLMFRYVWRQPGTAPEAAPASAPSGLRPADTPTSGGTPRPPG